MDPGRLKKDHILGEIRLKINESLRQMRDDLTEMVNLDHEWDRIQNALISIGKT